jgi:hypothetical protein
MTNYRREGSAVTVEYEDNSYVSADFNERAYTVAVDGVLIGQNFSTFARSNSGAVGRTVPDNAGEKRERASASDSYLAYSFGGEPVSYPLPASFEQKKPLAVILTTEGEGGILNNVFNIDGDQIVLTLPPMTPVKFF